MTWLLVLAMMIVLPGYLAMIYIVQLPPVPHRRGMVTLHLRTVDLMLPRWLTVYLIASTFGLPLFFLFASMDPDPPPWPALLGLSMVAGGPIALSVHNLVARQRRVIAAAAAAHKAYASDAPVQEKQRALRRFAGASLLPHAGPGLVVAFVVLALIAFGSDVAWLGVALLVSAALTVAWILWRRAYSSE